MLKLWLQCFILLLFINGCNNKQNSNSEPTKKMALKYAKNFVITYEEGFRVLHQKDPWHNNNYLSQLILWDGKKQIPPTLKSKYKILRTPVERIASMSHTNIGMLNALEQLHRIVSVGTPKTIYSDKIFNSFEAGKIIDIGRDWQLDVERVIASAPDLIMKSGYSQSATDDQHLHAMNIPIIYNIEWMEDNFLARAEWIKLFGILTNQENAADSIFNMVDHNYAKLLSKLEHISTPPKVMMGNDFKGVWYVPGGKSYMGKLLKNLKAEYFMSNDTTSGSLPFSYEVIYDQMTQADFWIYSGSAVANNNFGQEEQYANFKPVKSGMVVGPYHRVNKRKANDYWESGVVRPDIILADLMKIFYPEMMKEHKLFYYKRLN